MRSPTCSGRSSRLKSDGLAASELPSTKESPQTGDGRVVGTGYGAERVSRGSNRSVNMLVFLNRAVAIGQLSQNANAARPSDGLPRGFAARPTGSLKGCLHSATVA